MRNRSVHTVHPSRREFIALGVGALAVVGVPFYRGRRRLARRTLPVMGTTAEIAVVHDDVRYAEAAIDAAFERLRQVEALLTRFDPGSDVGRANRLAAWDGVPVTRETARVLRAALDWAERTDGAFDPCLGRAIVLWDVGHRRAPPAEGDVRAYAGRRLYRSLDVDDAAGRRPAVRFADPAVAIDLGGIGKGYGVDQAVRVLRDRGIARGLVNAGGDLYAMGASEDDDAWKVGIRSPSHPDRIMETVDVRDAAIATSGDYLQYFQHGGRRYHHLLDPATGAPSAGRMRSITVRAPDCLSADAAATAGFGRQTMMRTMHRAWGVEILSAVS